ncbi:MAG: hypothetical protein ABIN94_09310 [Ferruginibacter sp.]
MKRTMTKQVKLTIEARSVKPDMIDFLQKNLKKNTGGHKLNIHLWDEKQNVHVDLRTGGFEMNDDLANSLSEKPELEVMVEVRDYRKPTEVVKYYGIKIWIDVTYNYSLNNRKYIRFSYLNIN